MYEGHELPQPIWREGELAEKPPQHAAHQEFHATTGHESVIDMRQIDEAGIAHMRRHYYAKITTVDEQVGRVIAALEDRGWYENSLIIFCSDHGEMLGDHHMAYKWLMYDPIVHIPLIIRHPGATTHSRTTEDLVSLMDIGPTILAAAGVPIPTYLEGRSLLPYLQDEPIQPREYVFAEDNYQIMLRSQTEKLVYYIGQESGEFYDLTSDPHELDNLWSRPEQAARKERLLNALLRWFTTSSYYNSGYKRGQQSQYKLRWPGVDAKLHGGNNLVDKQVDVL